MGIEKKKKKKIQNGIINSIYIPFALQKERKLPAHFNRQIQTK